MYEVEAVRLEPLLTTDDLRTVLRVRIWIRRTHMFEPPGFGSGSGSFHHQSKIVRKSLISTVLWLLHDFISWKNDVNEPSKVISKNIFCLLLEDPWQKEQDPWYGSADPDPYQTGTDPQHCPHVYILASCRQCCGSMTFWCGSGSGSGSADPCQWLMDPAIFVIYLQDANKKLIFLF